MTNTHTPPPPDKDAPDNSVKQNTLQERHILAARQQQLDRTVAFGKELRRRRIKAGYRYVKTLAEAAEISLPYLSQIEKGYRSDDGRPVELGDDKMKKISDLLDWPLRKMYETLGKIPEAGNIFKTSLPSLQEGFAKLPDAEQLEFLRQLLNSVSLKQPQGQED